MPDFGPYSVLLDFTAGIEDPAVQFLGEKLAEECEHAGFDRATCPTFRRVRCLSRITDHYMQILANQAPIGFEAEFVNQREATILYRGILLPYSSDGETIDFIYGVINWKEMADQQTSDELLLEIDQALDAATPTHGGLGDRFGIAAGVSDGASDAIMHADLGQDEDVPDWADGPMVGDDLAGDDLADEDLAGDALAGDVPPEDPVADLPQPVTRPNPIFPSPSFGQDLSADDTISPTGDSPFAVDYGDSPAEAPHPEDEEGADAAESPTDGVVARLSSLIQPRNGHRKPTALLDPLDEGEAWDQPDMLPMVPTEEPADVEDREVIDTAAQVSPDERSPLLQKKQPQNASMPVAYEPEISAETAEPGVTDAIDPNTEHDLASVDSADNQIDTAETVDNHGLYDSLAEARELALAARTSEDRSRSALYAAVGRAYDVGLAAEAEPDAFAQLVDENGLTMQDRAPMTPVTKLVFGADYNKSRLAEYAAVLNHARRHNVPRGTLAQFLQAADGGLKGIVKAERALRREEAGKPAKPHHAIKPKMAKALRALEPVSVNSLSADGAEFGLVMLRREADGTIALLGEVSGDSRLVEKAAKQLLG